MSDYQTLKTLMGIGITDLPAKLDEQLPPEAYKAVPGAADLTDIDPNYMNRTLNQVFGLCGIGWGYTVNVDPRWDSYTSDKGRQVYSAHAPSVTFWFKMVDEDGGEIACSIPSTGGSENSSLAYALKGAITYAVGQAVSKIGFQESVYLGKRDHRTVKGAGAAAIQRPTAKVAAKPSDNGKPTAPAVAARKPAPTLSGDGAAAKPAPEAAPSDNGANPAHFALTFGAHRGKTLTQCPREYVEWLAEKMQVSRPDSPAAKAREAAQQFLAATQPA